MPSNYAGLPQQLLLIENSKIELQHFCHFVHRTTSSCFDYLYKNQVIIQWRIRDEA